MALRCAVALVEPLDAATGVDQLLLAGEERVALVAELDVELAARWWTVVNVLPHEHCTVVSVYSGWMSVFMAISRGR